MANLEIAGAHKRTQKGSVDYYYGGDNEAWADLASAKAGVPSSIRPGKTVGVYVSGQIVEYWWPDATHVADGDLVVKQAPPVQALGTGDSPTFAGVTIAAGNLKLDNNQSVESALANGNPVRLFYLDNYDNFHIGDGGIGALQVSATKFLLATTHSGDQYTEKYQFDGSIKWENIPSGTASRQLFYDETTGNITYSSYIQHYRGKYASLSALQTAVATGNDGDYAIISASPNDEEYIWDSDNTAWVLTTNVPASTFALLGGDPSDNTALAAALNTKVDKITGKGLSTNDYTTSEQTKLSGIAPGATANSAATLTEAETGTDGSKFIVSSVLAGWWAWIKTQAATISGLWNFTGGLQSGGNTVETQNNKATDLSSNDNIHYPTTAAVKTVTDANTTAIAAREVSANKDATGGYAGLTLFKINFKNALNTFTSYFANGNTASRTYTFQDRNGTILDDTDKTTLNSAIALKDNAAIAFNDQTGTSYTVALTDASQKIRMSNAAANTVTIPLNSSVAFPVGSYFYVSMQGTGKTSITGANGVTLQGVTTTIDVQYNEALVWKEATDTWKVIGITPDVSAVDGPLASVKRNSSLNKVLFNNTVNSVGGLGNGILQASVSQYLTGSDAGLATGSSITATFVLVYSNTGSINSLLRYGNPATSGLYFTCNIVFNHTVFHVYNGSTELGNIAIDALATTSVTHFLIVTINGSTLTVYLNGSAYSITLSAYNVSLNGVFSTQVNSSQSTVGTIGQIAVYNRVLSTTSGAGGTDEIAAIYNAGVGTRNLPTSVLIRQYLFAEGSGTTTADSNPNGTQYTLTLTGGASWAGVGSGLIPVAGATALTQYLDQSDGVYAGESSTVDVADILSGTNIRGKNIRHVINSVVTYLNTSAGHLFSKTNTNSTKASSSCVDIDGNVTIGSTYAGTNAAPADGLIVQGKSGHGVSSPSAWGHFAASTTTAGTAPIKLATGTLMTTPEAGAIEFDGTNLYFTSSTPTRNTLLTTGTGVTLSSNNTYTGTQTYNNTVSYGGTVLAASGIGRVVNYTTTLRANADNDNLIGLDLSNITYDTTNVNGANSTHLSTTGVSITNGGSGYVNGTYSNSLALTTVTGSGSGASIFGIVVSGGIVTSYGSIQLSGGAGSGYRVGDTLTVSNTLLGGSGNGLVLTVTAVNLTGVVTLDLKVNSIQSSANGTGRLGNGFSNWFAGVSAATIYTQVFRGLDNSGYDWLQQSGSTLFSVNQSGGLNLTGATRGTDSGYKIDVGTGSIGSLRTTGTNTVSSGVGRSIYINNIIKAAANNDTLVGLDINNTFDIGLTYITALGTITGGSGYTNGTFNGTALTGGSGSGATANITVSGGVITAVTLVNRGTGYAAGNTLSASLAGGSGFSIPVSTVGLTGTKAYSLRTSGDILVGGKINTNTSGGAATSGTATLSSGTITVNTTAVTGASQIFLTHKTPAGTLGILAQGTITAGTSFVINSLNTDTTVNTADTSTVNWWIIN